MKVLTILFLSLIFIQTAQAEVINITKVLNDRDEATGRNPQKYLLESYCELLESTPQYESDFCLYDYGLPAKTFMSNIYAEATYIAQFGKKNGLSNKKINQFWQIASRAKHQR